MTDTGPQCLCVDLGGRRIIKKKTPSVTMRGTVDLSALAAGRPEMTL